LLEQIAANDPYRRLPPSCDGSPDAIAKMKEKQYATREAARLVLKILQAKPKG